MISVVTLILIYIASFEDLLIEDGFLDNRTCGEPYKDGEPVAISHIYAKSPSQDIVTFRQGPSCFLGRSPNPIYTMYYTEETDATINGIITKIGTCHNKGDVGAACTQNYMCLTFICDVAGTGKCLELYANGASCTADAAYNCKSGFCNDALVCADVIEHKGICTGSCHPFGKCLADPSNTSIKRCYHYFSLDNDELIPQGISPLTNSFIQCKSAFYYAKENEFFLRCLDSNKHHQMDLHKKDYLKALVKGRLQAEISSWEA